MASKDELTAKIKDVGDQIRDLKSAKAAVDAIMPKVNELKELKAEYEKVTGTPFDPPKEKDKKKEKKTEVAGAASGDDKPSKNELKKAAKAAKKDAAKAVHKAAGTTTGDAPAPAVIKTSSKKEEKTLEPLPPASGKIHRSVTAITDLGMKALDGATLFYNASTSLVTAYALAMAPDQMVGLKMTKNGPAELPRLVFNNKQVVGDHAIARLILACNGDDRSVVDKALADQWLDLANMFGATETPFLKLLDTHLASATFLSAANGGVAPGLADAACYACLSAPGSPAVDDIQQTNIVRWMKAINGSSFLKQARAVLSGNVKPPASKTSASGVAAAGDAANADNDHGCPPLEGAIDGQVVTRFPPEPSGFLHIGHAKACLLNEYYARHYHGKLLVRFDDTNPSKEKEEFESNILRDLESLQVKPDAISHSSDHFEVCQELARKLIKEGNAFMDDTPQEQMQDERRNKINSKRRDTKPEESLEIFEKLLKGDAAFAHFCLRAKMDMQSENGTLRDPVLYRYNATPHHRTGTRYKAYPTYDLVCPIVDAIEGVTHCLRTTEYNDRDFQYHRLQEMLGLRHVRIHSFAKLNFVQTVLSKRKLQWFVDNEKVPNWNDPRFPTIQGVVRRGVTMSALRKFIYQQGASRNIVLQEWDKFWSINKDEFEPIAPRYQGVAANNAVKLEVRGGDANFDGVDFAAKTVALVPSQGDESVQRPMRLANYVYLESEDANDCNVGDVFILLMWGVCELTHVEKDGQGKVVSLKCVRKPEASVKKIKKKFNFVAETKDIYKAKILEYDHLITKPKLEEGENFIDFINPLSFGEMPVFVEPALRNLKHGDIIQLVRRGFFRVDKVHESEESPVELIFIPDGKTKSMSTLSTALPHR